MTPNLRIMLKEALGDLLPEVEEIRLRIGRPVLLRLGQKEVTVDNANRLTSHLQRGVAVTRQELERNLEILSQSSLYAWEDEFKNGYLTIPGGHRIGLAGRGVLEKGEIKTLKDISGFNYRIGREIRGCSDEVIPFVVGKDKVYSTIIVSPPRCGKTTLLRDMVRQLSDGVEELGFGGVNVGLVDERSEIAGMYLGEPQFDIGLRTDVLDACPKAQGMIMLIRSMSPGIVATDEIGKKEDVQALYESLRAGVSVITTVHGSSMEDVLERPVLKDLLCGGFFERLVVLSRRKGAGTLESIHDGKTLERMN
jgi:stage III sporulation protein AA